MTLFVQQMVTGLSVGSIYALMAIGYALIYSLLNFTNFAHGITVTIGAFATFFFLTYAMQNLYAAIIIGVAAGAVLAVVIELLSYHPMIKKKTSRVYLMIAGLGISVLGDNLIVIFFTGRFRIYPINFSTEAMNFLGISIGLVDVIIFVLSMIILLCITLFITKTRMGLAIRCAAFDLDITALMGVNTMQLILVSFLLAGTMAGMAGAMLGAKYTAYPSLGTFMTNKAFICSVVGGLGSLPGAVLGAMLLGVSETLISGYVSSALRDLFSYFILVVILLVRPSGLLGKSSEDKA